MTDLCILNEAGEPVPEPNISKWADWMSSPKQLLKSDTVDGMVISTVFLGMPHIGGMFETMVFGGPLDQMRRRYRTKAEALEGHKEIMKEFLP